MQLFYKNPDLTAGTTYTLDVTVDALEACDVYLQSTAAGNLRSLSAGSNTISITYEEGAGASFAFIVPVTKGSSNTFTITAVTWAQAI